MPPRPQAGVPGTVLVRASPHNKCWTILILLRSTRRVSSTYRSTMAINPQWATGWRSSRLRRKCAGRPETNPRTGFEPAIWVAPFIAEAKSNLFQQHPDWFVKDDAGKPLLRSDKVTFGGWRRGPWYVLDGTHPQVQQHYENLFRTMRREWGCTYFKLDANFWGAIHGGRFHDPRATRVEAYRRGMQAILRGADDGFILGCNHPIWASVGLIHGSRSSNDIKRTRG